jgi:hypothetical protein
MKPYTEEEVNAAIARVETAKQNKPRGWVYLEDMGLKPADPFVEYAFRNADTHAMRLATEDARLIYAAGWLQGLSIGVALAQGRAAEAE